MQTTAVASLTLPRVNLLPPEIEERKRAQQAQAAIVLIVVAVVGGVGALYYQGTHKVSDAKQQLAQASAQNAQLTKQVAAFGDVQATQAALNASEATLTQAMGTEVRWSGYLSDLGFLPHGTWISNLTLTNSLAPGSLTSSMQASPVVGSMSVTGTTLNYNDLATWLDSLSQVTDPVTQKPVLSDIYFSKAEEAYIGPTKVVNFQGTADVPIAGMSGRCATPGSC